MKTDSTTTIKPQKAKSNIKLVEQEYAGGLNVVIKNGSLRKQKLSNYVTIEMQDERASSTIKLTIRQARALREMLKNLD